jgi:protease-4
MPSRVLLCMSVLIAIIVSTSGCIIIDKELFGPGPVKEEQVGGTGKAKVVMIELTGLISSQEEEGFITGGGPSMISRLKEQLARAADDSKVKALVVKINSPGGTVTASDMLYHEIRAFREKHKIPVIASILDVGASGGYYVAAAADKIVAHPSSVTGSLGVIMVTVNARGLLEKIGVEPAVVTSGPRKDMGSPFRAMTDDERTIFQGVINSFYNRFLAVIKEGRHNLTEAEIQKLADGRIYSGEQAKAVGLVDSVGYLEDAIDLAKRQAGLTEARIVVYRKQGEFKQNIYSRLSGGIPSALASLDVMALARVGSPQFMYLWWP